MLNVTICFSALICFSLDIPLLPSISALSAVDDEEPGGLFTVHWLNNKELHFTLAMEVFLQQFGGSLEQRNESSNEGSVNYFQSVKDVACYSKEISSPMSAFNFRA